MQHNIVKGETGIDTLRHLALVTMNTTYPQGKWLHIFTEGSQMDGYINAGVSIYCELFSCYIPLGRHSTAFDGEIEALRTTLRLLNLHQNKFERAVIFSDTKAAVLTAGSTGTVILTEAKECQPQIRYLKARHKQIAQQWIPGHCQIAGNEHADTLARKVAKITQTHIGETCYRSIKLHLNRCFKVCTDMNWRQNYPKTHGSKK